MTSRCEIFIPDEKEMNQEESLALVHENFSKTMSMLVNWAKKNNVPLEDLQQEDPAWAARREYNKQHARTNITSKLALEYRKKASDIRAKYATELNIFKTNLENRAELGLKGDSEIVREVHHAMETIMWYETQIPVKITMVYMSFGQLENETPSIQSHYNGVAKVALHCIEKCFPAWEILIKYFPEMEDDCWNCLVLLDRARKLLLADFPDAPKFIRPGFDD